MSTSGLSNSTTVTPSNGIVGGYTGNNTSILRVMMAFSAIAWYNCGELILLILIRFKKRKGLYFWSLMITAWAIIIYQIGVWGKMVNITRYSLITQTLDNIGWVFMVGGNSFILYSRLHLITLNHRMLRMIFWAIIVNTILMYIPTTALDYGCNIHNSGGWCRGYSIMERIQMTMFSIQEFTISGIYLMEAWRYLKTAYVPDKRSKRVIYELVCVNIVLIILDVALLSVEYVDLYQIEVTLKGLVYSVKAKLELGVLSRLVKIVTQGTGLQRTTGGDTATWATFDKTNDIDCLETIRTASHSGGKGGTGTYFLSPVTSASTTPGRRRMSSHVAPRPSIALPQPQPPVPYSPEPVEEPETIDALSEPYSMARVDSQSSRSENCGVDLESALYSYMVCDEPITDLDGRTGVEYDEMALPDVITRPAAVAREPSRRSSIADLYPGRITGG
ncbi:hypothetical protein MBLNU457_6410t1 [Dothideomycetes sp. NU457]